jgi:hypothetical protein
MKGYTIYFQTFGNFSSFNIFYFKTKPTKEECKAWIWNMLLEYEKETLDWDLKYDDVEIIKIKEIK